MSNTTTQTKRDEAQSLLSTILSPEEMRGVKSVSEVQVEEKVEQIVPIRAQLFARGTGQSHKEVQIVYKSPRGFEATFKAGRFALNNEAAIPKEDADILFMDEQGDECVWIKGTLNKGHYAKAKDPNVPAAGFASKVKKVHTESGDAYIAVKKDDQSESLNNDKNVPRARLEKYIPDTIDAIVVAPEEATYEAKKVWEDLVESREMAWFSGYVPQTKEAGLRRGVLYPIGTPEKFGFVLMSYANVIDGASRYLMVDEGTVKAKSKKKATTTNGASVQVRLADE